MIEDLSFDEEKELPEIFVLVAFTMSTIWNPCKPVPIV
jgi:hypothetical protein